MCIQILTKDSVTARVDAVVYFRIVNPTSSIVKVENAYNSTYLLAQTTLRSVLGTKKLGELLSERESISAEMQVMWCAMGRVGMWWLHHGFVSPANSTTLTKLLNHGV